MVVSMCARLYRHLQVVSEDGSRRRWLGETYGIQIAGDVSLHFGCSQLKLVVPVASTRRTELPSATLAAQIGRPLAEEDHGWAKFTLFGEFHDVFRAVETSIVGSASDGGGMVSTIDDVVLRCRLHPSLRKQLNQTRKKDMLKIVADTGVRVFVPEEAAPITELASLEGPLAAVVDVFSGVARLLASKAVRVRKIEYMFPGRSAGALIGERGSIAQAFAPIAGVHSVSISKPTDPRPSDMPIYAGGASAPAPAAAGEGEAGGGAAAALQTGGCWCCKEKQAAAMAAFVRGEAVAPLDGALGQAWQVVRMTVITGHDWAAFAALAYARCVLDSPRRTESLAEHAPAVLNLCIDEGMPAVVPRSLAGMVISSCAEVAWAGEAHFVLGNAAEAALMASRLRQTRPVPRHGAASAGNGAPPRHTRDRRGSRDSRSSRGSTGKASAGKGSTFAGKGTISAGKATAAGAGVGAASWR